MYHFVWLFGCFQVFPPLMGQPGSPAPKDCGKKKLSAFNVCLAVRKATVDLLIPFPWRIYLPTWKADFCGIGKYTIHAIHGSYGFRWNYWIPTLKSLTGSTTLFQSRLGFSKFFRALRGKKSEVPTVSCSVKTEAKMGFRLVEIILPYWIYWILRGN